MFMLVGCPRIAMLYTYALNIVYNEQFNAYTDAKDVME